MCNFLRLAVLLKVIDIHTVGNKRNVIIIITHIYLFFFFFLWGLCWVCLTSGFISFKLQEDGMVDKPTVATKPSNWRRSFSSTLTWRARGESRCPTPWAWPSARWRSGFRTEGWSGKKRTTKTSFRVRGERLKPRKRATRTVKGKRRKRKKRKKKRRPRSDFMVLFMVIWLKGRKERVAP